MLLTIQIATGVNLNTVSQLVFFLLTTVWFRDVLTIPLQLVLDK